MFDRLQKPFLTVETGEAYQPIRLTYQLHHKDKLIERLNELKCCEKTNGANSWNWFWKNECDNLHFESVRSYRKNPDHPLRLATLMIHKDTLFINLPSFKRACLAVAFFDKMISLDDAKIDKADFINKVFGTDERLPHGFTELFKEEELEKLISQRAREYHDTQERMENADTAQEAFDILNTYSKKEAKKRLPYAERYVFDYQAGQDPDVSFLGFYIFLRGRELVAIRRWYGEIGYTIDKFVDDTIEQVFGNMDIDIID